VSQEVVQLTCSARGAGVCKMRQHVLMANYTPQLSDQPYKQQLRLPSSPVHNYPITPSPVPRQVAHIHHTLEGKPLWDVLTRPTAAPRHHHQQQQHIGDNPKEKTTREMLISCCCMAYSASSLYACAVRHLPLLPGHHSKHLVAAGPTHHKRCFRCFLLGVSRCCEC